MRLWTIALGVCALLISISATVASAQSTDQADGADRLNLSLEGETITNPDWITPPSGDDLVRLYPPLASILDIKGAATITCNVEVDGKLSSCIVIRETPLGLGFGNATLLAAVNFRMKPAMRDGKAVVGVVTIPIKWQLDENHNASFADSPESPTFVSPAALELARRIAGDKQRLKRISDSFGTYTHKQIEIEVMGGAPVPNADVEARVFSLLQQNYMSAAIAYVDILAHKYAKDMSIADLQQTAAFLETPAGQAWIEETEQESTLEERKAYDRLTVQARSRTRDELCRQLGCDPEKH